MATAISATTAAPNTLIPYTSRQAAKVHQLRQQGENPSQIAATLGLSTATVDGYLGIATPNAASIPGAALTAAPAQSGATVPAISIFA
jgi:DNA-binding CsgD family transcriptional regulator